MPGSARMTLRYRSFETANSVWRRGLLTGCTTIWIGNVAVTRVTHRNLERYCDGHTPTRMGNDVGVAVYDFCGTLVGIDGKDDQ